MTFNLKFIFDRETDKIPTQIQLKYKGFDVNFGCKFYHVFLTCTQLCGIHKAFLHVKRWHVN